MSTHHPVLLGTSPGGIYRMACHDCPWTATFTVDPAFAKKLARRLATLHRRLPDAGRSADTDRGIDPSR